MSIGDIILLIIFAPIMFALMALGVIGGGLVLFGIAMSAWRYIFD